MGSLLGVGAEGWASECTGKGTVAQSGCQEAFGRPPRLQIRIAGCDHKGREQQASEVQIRTPASNPHSRLRSQGSPSVSFDANHNKGRGDDDHWLGGAPPGASKHQEVDSGDLCDRSLLWGFEPGSANLNRLLMLTPSAPSVVVFTRVGGSFLIRTAGRE